MRFSLLFFFFLCILLINGESLYSSTSKVVQLTSVNFHNLVIKGKQPWIVEFYSPGCPHCRNLVPEYEKLATALEGIINVGAVDTQTEQQIASPYNIKGVPSIKFFGLDKSNPLDYQGGRTASDMVNYALEQAKKIAQSRLSGKQKSSSSKSSSSNSSPKEDPKAEVIILTDSDFEEMVMKSSDAWFIEFYAPWCGHCKQLQPEWERLAKKLSNEVKVAKVDATTETKLASRFQIQGYPTIKYFPAGTKSDSSVIDYNGQRDTESMGAWALEKKGSKPIPVKFDQLTDQATFKEFCEDFKGLCIIAFLPHMYDSSKEERKSYITVLEELSKKFKGNPFSFLWVQGGDYYDFEEALSLSAGYPAVVAINFSKNMYSIMRSAYTKKNVELYINGLLSGKEASYKMKETPKLKTVEKWDGKDMKREEVLNEDL